MDRVDGRLKVTGGAKYAGEFAVANLAHAVLVQSTIARGRVREMDVRAAERAPGVLAVITYANQPTTARPTNPPSGDSKRLLDPEIVHSGQNIGVVIAETFEEALAASEMIRVVYDTAKSDATFEDRLDTGFAPKTGNRPADSKRGDIEAGLRSGATKVDQIYRTPIEHHNPMEPHATIAMWKGEELLAYDATQGVANSAQNLAEQFHLTPDQVHVIDPFVGGGFGCKGQSWPHTPIAAMAAKVVGRPVKLELTRRQMFTSNGHRPPTRQADTFAADEHGKLVALRHEHHNHTSQRDEFMEPTGSLHSLLYSCPNVLVSHKLVRADVPAPTYQRAPGESSGSFSIETAMDELAWQLGIDPLELRLRNYAEKDEAGNKPWSSKSLRDCYRRGAERFGWSERNPKIGSMTKEGLLVGYGMATASYPANFRAAAAKARMYPDGRVLIQCGTQDLGTGTYTILTQIAADAIGVSPSFVRVEIGDSKLPGAPTSGGSCSAASAGSAVMAAAQALRGRVIGFATADETSPLWNLGPKELDVKEGRISAKADPSRSMTYAEIFARYGKDAVEQTASAQPGMERGPAAAQGSQGGQAGPGGYTMQAFGAQFCEVHIDPELRTVRVARWVGSFAVGKVLNEKTCRSQLHGGIVWGIGMGLLEETIVDPRHGRFLNTNLAEYHVPVNRDIPPIEIILVPEEDKLVSLVGAKGAGEIGITGVAAAIGNAIHHATGKRVRDIPITLDKIL